jgi:hypothetical protein
LILRLLFLLYWPLSCLLGGFCTKLSSLKVETTLTNLNTTASASSLDAINSFSHCLCYLFLCSIPFLGDDLLALASGNLCQTWRTSVPVTRSSTNILAAGHADKTL